MTSANPVPTTRTPAGAPDPAPALRVEGLTKRYGSRVAVDGLTVEVPRGVIAGFIGPNGAGKTTTMAMLLGLVTPTSGEGTVLGEPLHDPSAYLRRVGALIEGPAFWPGLTGEENLRVLATLGGHDARRVPALLDRVGLGDRGSDRFGTYSLGMKQRLGIAAALVGDPELLVLDEPTNGLDPVGISEMRALVASLRREDRTVLVSSHLLSELEQVADWLVVIDGGSLVHSGPAEGFLARATPVLVAVPEQPGALDRLHAVVREAGHEAETVDGAVYATVTDEDARAAAARVNRAAFGVGVTLAELAIRRPSLESHYLSLVTGDDR